MIQQSWAEHNKHNEEFAQFLEESKIRQAEFARIMAHNEMISEEFTQAFVVDSDRNEVLSNDIEVKVVDEDVTMKTMPKTSKH